MKGDFAIIPVREFSSAKFRLTNYLTNDERTRLTSTLLNRVARASEASHIEGIIVVASDPTEASTSLTGISKVSVISERTHHGGVSSAMRTGIDFANRNGGKRIALYPSDLPLLTHSRIDDAFGMLEDDDIVMNPSLKKDGTNLLAMRSSVPFTLHYDDDSFNKHSLEARQRGLNLVVLDWKEFSVDLDDAADLDRIMIMYKSKNFEDLLNKITENMI